MHRATHELIRSWAETISERPTFHVSTPEAADGMIAALAIAMMQIERDESMRASLDRLSELIKVATDDVEISPTQLPLLCREPRAAGVPSSFDSFRRHSKRLIQLLRQSLTESE